jgi:hypothetical protein
MRKLITKKNLYISIFIVCVTVLFLWCNRIYKLTEWGMSIAWHLKNGKSVSLDNCEILLPLKWWVYSKNGRDIDLAVVTPRGIDFWGLVTIRKESLDSTSLDYNLHKLPTVKNAGDYNLSFVQFDTIKIDRAKAVGAIYDVVGFEKKEYGIWMIPGKKITIIAVNIHKGYRDIFGDLLKSVRFTEDLKT